MCIQNGCSDNISSLQQLGTCDKRLVSSSVESCELASHTNKTSLLSNHTYVLPECLCFQPQALAVQIWWTSGTAQWSILSMEMYCMPMLPVIEATSSLVQMWNTYCYSAWAMPGTKLWRNAQVKLTLYKSQKGTLKFQCFLNNCELMNSPLSISPIAVKIDQNTWRKHLLKSYSWTNLHSLTMILLGKKLTR